MPVPAVEFLTKELCTHLEPMKRQPLYRSEWRRLVDREAKHPQQFDGSGVPRIQRTSGGQARGAGIGQQAGPQEWLGMAMGLGLLLGAALFIAAAVLGERNALWIPAVVLIAAAVGSLVA